MRRILDWYQYIGPAILTPLGYWLWWRHYDGDHGMAAFAFAIPILFAYIVPAVGTNMLKVWEFDTRFRLGHFRPHHGFVFGSATAILALPAVGAPNPLATAGDMIATGFIVASVLGFWNWIYDIAAIRAGILKVYNQPYADGAGPAAVTADYAPIFFGGFGFVFGCGIRAAERLLSSGVDWWLWAALFAAVTGAALILPVLFYVAFSHMRHGHSGCHPVGREPT